MATLQESCDALRLLLGGEETGIEPNEEITLMVAACANVIVHTLLAITDGDVRGAQEGLRVLVGDMSRNLDSIGRTVQ